MERWQSFANWLKKHRMAIRYSQGRLAEATGISRSYITRMEGGAVQLPEQETRAKFHEVFGTTDDDLVAEGVAVRNEYVRADGHVTVVYEAAPKPEGAEPATIGDTADPDAEPLPAHLRASFLKLETMTPERRQRIIELIEDQAALDEIERERLRRDEGT